MGVAGLLGSKLMEIGKGNYGVYVTYLQHKINQENVFPLDVTKRSKVFDLIEKIKPDLIIDSHSITNVDACELYLEEAWLVNVESTKSVAEACKTFGSK